MVSLYMVVHVLPSMHTIATHPTEEMSARRVTLPPNQMVQLLKERCSLHLWPSGREEKEEEGQGSCLAEMILAAKADSM
jgi:hypothetical protein